MCKKERRKEYLEKRNSLPKEFVDKYSKVICKKLLDYIDKINIDKENITICMYMAKGNEVNLEYAINKIFTDKKYSNISLAFPKVFEKEMSFYIAKSFDDFEMGSFNILEPNLTCELLKENNQIKIAFIPAIAFNKEGARLGYGAGYYDKFFSKFKALYLVGIGFSFQIDVDFYADGHDIKMDYIITE